MNQAQRLADRIALITGATRGIGSAVAKRFAMAGARIILAGRSQNDLEAIAGKIRAACGNNCVALLAAFDLTDADAIDRLAENIGKRWGKLDILVGNAAVRGKFEPLHRIDPVEWDNVIAVNLTANWRLIRAFEPLLRASDAGRAIFVTSSAAKRAHKSPGVYPLSKAALELMVSNWGNEVANTTLRVNLIDPGGTRTRMRAEDFPEEDPMTLLTPDDVAGAFVELADPTCHRHGEVVLAYAPSKRSPDRISD